MAQVPRLTISDVVARTGVPASTVHHYRRAGLLTGVRRSSANQFAFEDRHVRAVQLVRLLRQRRAVPLQVIRRVLPELLELDEEEAFRDDMWDALVTADRERNRRASPSHRLLTKARRSFARRGYANVNVDELCEAAGVAKGSFYRYFHSKEDLFLAAAAESTDEVLADFEREARRRGPSLGPEAAVQVLAPLLEPELPLLLDLLSDALRHRPGYARTAREALDRLATGIGRCLRTSVDSREAGTRVIQRAVAVIIDGALVPRTISEGTPLPGGHRRGAVPG